MDEEPVLRDVPLRKVSKKQFLQVYSLLLRYFALDLLRSTPPMEQRLRHGISAMLGEDTGEEWLQQSRMLLSKEQSQPMVVGREYWHEITGILGSSLGDDPAILTCFVRIAADIYINTVDTIKSGEGSS